MAKKAKPKPPAEEDHPRVKVDPNVVFEAWLKTCTEAQRQTILEVDTTLLKIQSTKKDLRRELQPLRVGMELSKAKQVIVGRSGKANPQQEAGRIWGAYRDSHLKSAGYSKSTCDTYVGMIDEARKVLPDDTLITALLDHVNEQGMVMMTRGDLERPFGKYTKYLKSKDVQMYVKDGKVDLGEQSPEDLVANVFDPNNVEESDTVPNMTAAVNGVVKRIVSEVKGELKLGNSPLDLTKVVENSRDYVRYVVECLLTVCNCPDMKDTFEPREEDIIELDKLLTLGAVVKKLNEKKQKTSAATPTKQKKAKKVVHVRQEPEKVADTRIGKYSIRKNANPQFPLTPWEIFEDGNDKPVARLQDRLQAQQHVEQHLQPKDAHSDRPPSSPAASQQQAEEIRKQREPARGGTQYDAG
jgi:hypothetical protein